MLQKSKHIGLLAIFICFTTLLFSQKVVTFYYNDYYDYCDSANAKYLAHYEYSDTIKQSGIIRITTLNGRDISKYSYSNIPLRTEDGLCVTYHDNGKIKTSVQYYEGLLHGEVTTYFSGGQLKRKDYFENNKFISGTCYGPNGNKVTHFDYKTDAVYPGGVKSLYKFIYINTHYPDEAKRQSITGTVYLKLLINKKGEITNIEVMKSVNPILDDEAVRVAKLLDNFIPGQEDGEKSNSVYILPIKYAFEK